MTTTKKPAFIAYAVTGEGKDAFWTRIGSVWPHNHGDRTHDPSCFTRIERSTDKRDCIT